jgi:hypothetical protein
MTDASGEGLGAVLSQGEITKDRPVAFASRTLNQAEKNYSTTEKELLAIVWGMRHFRPYLYGLKYHSVEDIHFEPIVEELQMRQQLQLQLSKTLENGLLDGLQNFAEILLMQKKIKNIMKCSCSKN